MTSNYFRGEPIHNSPSGSTTNSFLTSSNIISNNNNNHIETFSSIGQTPAAKAKNSYMAETVLGIWKETGILDPLQKQISALLFGTLVRASSKKSQSLKLHAVTSKDESLLSSCTATNPLLQDLILDSLCCSGNLTLAQIYMEMFGNGSDWDVEEAWKTARTRNQRTFNVSSTGRKSQLETILFQALPKLLQRVGDLEKQLEETKKNLTLVTGSSSSSSNVKTKTAALKQSPKIITSKPATKNSPKSGVKSAWNSSTVIFPAVSSASSNNNSSKSSISSSPVASRYLSSANSRKKEVAVSKPLKSSKQGGSSNDSKGYLKGTASSNLHKSSSKLSDNNDNVTGILKKATPNDVRPVTSYGRTVSGSEDSTGNNGVSFKKSVSFTFGEEEKRLLSRESPDVQSTSTLVLSSSSRDASDSTDDDDFWWTDGGDGQAAAASSEKGGRTESPLNISRILTRCVFPEEDILDDIQSFIEEPIFEENNHSSKEALSSSALASTSSSIMDMSEEDLAILASASPASPSISPQTNVKQPKNVILSKTLYRSPLQTINPSCMGGGSYFNSTNHFLSLWGMALRQPPPPCLAEGSGSESTVSTLSLSSAAFSSGETAEVEDLDHYDLGSKVSGVLQKCVVDPTMTTTTEDFHSFEETY